MHFTFRGFVKSLSIYKAWHNELELMRLESMANGAFNSLDILHSIFEAKSIEYWLFAGTLLGFIRDGGPIIGDPDIDLGFWKKDMLLIEKAVVDNGFIKIHEFSFDGTIYEQRYEYGGVGIDFFYFCKDDEIEYTYQFNRKVTSFYPVKEEHFDNEFSNIVEKNFSGHVYKIPNDYERILENTIPGVITPHVHHLYDNCADFNHSEKCDGYIIGKIKIKSSDYTIVDYRKNSLFSSNIKLLGFDFKKYSVIKND